MDELTDREFACLGFGCFVGVVASMIFAGVMWSLWS